MDLHIAVPTIDIKRITFSQFLIYSKRMALKRAYERIHDATAARMANVKAKYWREYINELHALLQELDDSPPTPAVSEIDLSKLDFSKSNFDDGDIEWLE